MSEVFLSGFNPTSISGLKVWFDASQTGTITSNSSGQVSSWSNLAGYANAVQATTSNMPYSGLSNVNSMNIMTFSNMNRLSYGPITYSSTNQCVFAVLYTPNNPYALQNFCLWIFGDGSDMGATTSFAGYQYQFSGFEMNSGGTSIVYIGGTTGVLTNSGAYSNAHILTVHKGSSSNGAYINSTSYSAASNFATGSYTDNFGAINTGNTFYIGEFLHYDANLSDAQRQSVEGYLAWKWGINKRIPTTHAYYSVNPNKIANFPTALQSLVTPSLTPLNIPGCQLWLDGADPAGTGTAPANGATVSTWVDKSGNGRNAVAVVAGVYSSAQKSITFSGTNYYNSPYTAAPTTETLFIVFNLTTNNNPFLIASPTCGGRVADPTPELQFAGGAICYTTGAITSSLLTIGSNTLGVVVTNGSSNFVSLHGALTLTGPTTGITYTSGTTTEIGGAVGATYLTNGYIYEVIAYNSVLSTTQRQQVEGYLANKWGIKTALPGAHPYYITPPTITLPLTVTQPYPPASAQIFSYTGSNQTYVVPSGAISLTVHLWGAGGGSGFGGSGGAGAYVQGNLIVTPGSSLTIIVGQGGSYNGGATYGNGGQSSIQYGYNGGKGSGGGRSAIQLSGTELVNAGGGGGGANGGSGGAANFSPTINGGAAYNGTGSGSGGTFGYGGTQTAGGAQGANPIPQGTNGSYLQGGIGASGGGGGFYGGGGGGFDSGAGGFGAGGGSSYTTNSQFTLITGSNSPNTGETAPATASSFYQTGVAGGGVSYGSGGNGLLVIVPTMTTPPAALLPLATSPNTAAITTIIATGAATYTVPAGASGVYVFLWGGAGGYGNQPNGVGGSGGFVSGFYACPAGTVLSYVIGNSLLYGTSGGTPTILNGGGGSSSGGGNVVGGGFAGIFNAATTAAVTQGNAIAIAGGGGAAGQYASAYGGGGGYPVGGSSVITSYGGYGFGGSQSIGGVGSQYNGSAIIGAGGGGGGYYGGGANGFGGGGGGSSYIGGLTSGAYYENGSNASATTQTILPGGYTNQYYASPYGQSSSTAYSNGRIVIIPALPIAPTFQITTAPTSQIITTLSYTGSYITYTVPSNIVSLRAYLWGAGGGFQNNSGIYGGGGALVTGIIAVSGGEQLRIIVGKGGANGSNVNSNYFATGTDAQGAGGGGGGSGGQGGGRSAVQKFIASTWTEVLTAGGGGGSANNAGDFGGNAHFTGTSQDAGNTYNQYTSAKGATQLAGGVGATITGRTPFNYPSNNGAAFVGGTALLNTDGAGGGGGGGGYFGGGGGGYNGGAEVSGGGGGSSYFSPTYVTGFAGSNGNNITPVGSSLPFYDGQAGLAQLKFAMASGFNGLVAFVATTGLIRPFQAVTSGGTITTSGDYRIHTFTTTGTSTFITDKAITAQVLIVAGGGSGSGDRAAGGGAGGLIFTNMLISSSTYSVIVGTGGTVGSGNVHGTNGSNSSFNGQVAIGGGSGGSHYDGAYIGSTGGSGGGGAAPNPSIPTAAGGAGTAGQGFGGGTGYYNTGIQIVSAGGGGGAGGPGSNATTAGGGNGGPGLLITIGGISAHYAGGGGGAGAQDSGPTVGGRGGVGGGGTAGQSSSINATPGTPNTGGGGAGAGNAGWPGNATNGGSGIVIIAFIP